MAHCVMSGSKKIIQINMMISQILKTKKTTKKENKSGKPRVLMFAPYSFPPMCAESIATTKFISMLLKNEWKIDVIASRDIIACYPKDDNHRWAGVEQSVHLVGYSGRRIFGLTVFKLKSVQWSLQAISVALKLLKKNKYDVILSRATPLYGHLPALIIQKKTQIPWIANWSDPVPQDKAPSPYGYGANAKLGLFETVYLSLISKYAQAHTFPCERLRQYYGLYLPSTFPKSWVVPHIALRGFQTSLSVRTEKFVVFYSGSLIFRPVDVLFQALRRLKDKIGEKFVLHFIVNEAQHLSDKAIQYDVVSLINVNSNISYCQTQTIIQDASAILILEAQCDEGIFLPSKVADIIQTGRPILAISPQEGVLNDLITQYGGGIVADNQSVSSVMLAIETLFEAWNQGDLQKNYGSSHLMALFDADTVHKKFSKIVNETIKA